MATADDDGVEYESDPDDAKQSLVMRRRRTASDDEDSEVEKGGEGEREGRDRVIRIHSDESDGQGGAADYYDDQDDEYLEEEEEEGEGEGEEEETYNEELVDDAEVHGQDIRNEDFAERLYEGKKVAVDSVSDIAAAEFGDTPLDGQINKDGVKKVNEPYAVPTAGAFYMHDDRFQDNAGGRHRPIPSGMLPSHSVCSSRRIFGSRKLWESKDERKWGHDKFEEMSMQEKHYEVRRRNSRGRTKGHGRQRGVDRGYGRGNRTKNFDNHSSIGVATNNETNNNQAPIRRAVRRGGTKRYNHSFMKRNRDLPSKNKLSMESVDNSQHDISAQTFAIASNFESDSAPARENAFGSSLSSASRPFYPSSSSNREGGLSQKKVVQTESSNGNQCPIMDGNFSGAQSNSLLRGKNVTNLTGMDKLSIDEVTAFAGKPCSPKQAAFSGSPPTATSQPSDTRTQGKGAAHAAGQMAYKSAFLQDQVNKSSLPLQAHTSQCNAVTYRVQPSAQQFGEHPGGSSRGSSLPKAAISVNSFDVKESETPSESSKSKGTLIAKGKGSIQRGERGSFICGDTRLLGAGGHMAVGCGDQDFPATPAILPVMQFAGQHPSGIGVPAVGMAFPGYVAQPQLGLGDSEMTWLPVLTSAAGTLGATYCSPYISVDGSYHTSSGQTTSAGSTSEEGSVNKHNYEMKHSQGTGVANEEQGQRQNKARRYSEMNFGQ